VSRPDHLPDFSNPPLNEVVLGVQFSAPQGYQQIYAYEVWELYREKFPLVEEQMSLPPFFETFGLPRPQQQQQPGLSLVNGAQHDRFWFLKPKKDELIQFQEDRLLHNWRKVGDASNPYPRFERMIISFEDELQLLADFMKKFGSRPLSTTQCEISYVNHIHLSASDPNSSASEFFRFMQFPSEKPEDFSTSFRRTIYNDAGAPIGRLNYDLQTAMSNNGQRVLAFTITARGAPSRPTIESALEFLKLGREMIVKSFVALTTDLAHETWGMKR